MVWRKIQVLFRGITCAWSTNHDHSCISLYVQILFHFNITCDVWRSLQYMQESSYIFIEIVNCCNCCYLKQASWLYLKISPREFVLSSFEDTFRDGLQTSLSLSLYKKYQMRKKIVWVLESGSLNASFHFLCSRKRYTGLRSRRLLVWWELGFQMLQNYM